jgi:hypothetical protein
LWGYKSNEIVWKIFSQEETCWFYYQRFVQVVENILNATIYLIKIFLMEMQILGSPFRLGVSH